MQISRYSSDPQIKLGSQLSTASAVQLIRQRLNRGIPVINRIVVTGEDRLDSLAGSIYGNAKYWWILAAASEIGWGLQVPPGTVLNIIDLESLSQYL